MKKKKYTQASHSKENAAKDTNTIFLSKLSAYLIQENAQYNWFKSFLKNHTQICFVSGSLSKTCYLQFGFPQGAIMGPLFFCYT